MVAFVARRRVVSCGAGCRSGWCGVKRMAKYAWIRTKRSPPPSAPCSTASPRSAPFDVYGCGFAPKSCCFHFDAFRVKPTYLSIHHVLSNAAYAGAYTYGKTRQERYLDAAGRVRQRIRHLPRSEWGVLIPDHHPGYITWETYLANQERIGSNIRPRPHEAGGAVREGTALLQGLAVCGRCGRRLCVSYHGRNATPGYYCAAGAIVNGHGSRCLRVGGQQIDAAVATAFLVACTPAGVQAALAAAQRLEADHDAALAQARMAVERARYEATRAERRYRAVDAENRLVARGLERDWEERLQEVAMAEAELGAREHRRPRGLTSEERRLIDRLGNDLEQVWTAPTTSARDRKELLRTLLAEVIVKVDRPA